MTANLVLPVNITAAGKFVSGQGSAPEAGSDAFAALLFSSITGENASEDTPLAIEAAKDGNNLLVAEGDMGLKQDLPQALDPGLLAAYLNPSALPTPQQTEAEPGLVASEELANQTTAELTADPNVLLTVPFVAPATKTTLQSEAGDLGQSLLARPQLPLGNATQEKAGNDPRTPPGLTADNTQASLPNTRQNAEAIRQQVTPAQDPTANLAASGSKANERTSSFAETLQSVTTQPAPAQQSNPTAPISHAHEVRAPLGTQQWNTGFGERIVWMARNDQQTAQLTINPPQLGPIQISLNLSGDQASAMFASPHAEVRQAIEDALPRLREMLSGNGITLGDANVGTQLPQQQRDTQNPFAAPSRPSNETAILSGESQPGTTTAAPVLLRGRGLVDLFA